MRLAPKLDLDKFERRFAYGLELIAFVSWKSKIAKPIFHVAFRNTCPEQTEL